MLKPEQNKRFPENVSSFFKTRTGKEYRIFLVLFLSLVIFPQVLSLTPKASSLSQGEESLEASGQEEVAESPNEENSIPDTSSEDISIATSDPEDGMEKISISPAASQSREEAQGTEEDFVYQTDYSIFKQENLLLIPNYYRKLYGLSFEYQDVFDAWESYEYVQAEKLLLETASAIRSSPALYFPQDLIFVEHALGVLYLELALYDNAYEYLLDAWVSLGELYGPEESLDSMEHFYPLAVELSLCHYYYEMGNYDSALVELEMMNDRQVSFSPSSQDEEKLQFFFQVLTRRMKADIYAQRGEFYTPHELYSENLLNISDQRKKGMDDSMLRILLIKSFLRYAEFLYPFSYGNPDFYAAIDKCYENSLELCNTFDDSEGELYKAITLVNHAKFLYNFNETWEEAQKTEEEAIAILDRRTSAKELDPEMIDLAIHLAEIQGYVKNDIDSTYPYYKIAATLCSSFYGKNHPANAKLLESLGRYYANVRGMYETALAYYEEAIEVYKNLLLENSRLLANVYYGAANCYRNLDEEEKANEYAGKAKRILEALGIETVTEE